MTYKFEECRKFVEWDFNGKDDKYTIRIRRHEKYSSELSKSYMRSDEGPHGWCLYIYIYPSHPLFDKITDESDYYVRPISDMPLHGGCTYMKWHRNPAGKITSKEIGCDYQHYCDEHYSRRDCPTQSSVWNDAQELAEFMDNYGEPNNEE